MGFRSATPVQRMCVPAILRDRKDVVAAAQTGSGKTSAFGLPILQRLLEESRSRGRPQLKAEDKKLWALILVPTRELALQVSRHIGEVGKHSGVSLMTITGGLAEEKQLRLLARCPEIVVATPGRFWHLVFDLKASYLKDYSELQFLVLDEADRMVEKGHFEELHSIIQLINTQQPKGVGCKRQTLLFSATLTTAAFSIEKLLESIHFHNQLHTINLTPQQVVATKLTELRIECAEQEKDLYLVYCLHTLPPGRVLVFVNSIDCLRRLVPVLQLLKFEHVYPLHSEMQQRQRLKNLDRFREAEQGVLIATDVASRGLDIPAVNTVIHYQIPRSFELYVHRSGRTARANRTGTSIEMVGPRERFLYQRCHRKLGRPDGLPEMPIEYRVLRLMRKRVKTARSLEKLQHLNKKNSAHNTWVKKTVEEADLVLDPDNLIIESKDQLQRRNAEIAQLQQKLAALLSESIHVQSGIHSLRYPTLSTDPSLPSQMTKIFDKQRKLLVSKIQEDE